MPAGDGAWAGRQAPSNCSDDAVYGEVVARSMLFLAQFAHPRFVRQPRALPLLFL